jgi:hypothetical protein
MPMLLVIALSITSFLSEPVHPIKKVMDSPALSRFWTVVILTHPLQVMKEMSSVNTPVLRI